MIFLNKNIILLYGEYVLHYYSLQSLLLLNILFLIYYDT